MSGSNWIVCFDTFCYKFLFMKKAILLMAVAVISMSFINWHYNMEEAKTTAKKEHKHIVLNFSGSDWCGPCIRLHK
ncbi:hypothetical protein BH11BAC5_BH11BAC5_01180 [soil metagenome]